MLCETCHARAAYTAPHSEERPEAPAPLQHLVQRIQKSRSGAYDPDAVYRRLCNGRRADAASGNLKLIEAPRKPWT